MEMPPPTDVAVVQSLRVSHSTLVLLYLSDITKPLRELMQRDTVWVWEQSQQDALATLKQAVSNTPVLRFYNVKEEVTLQCDASQSGLGAALMQNEQRQQHYYNRQVKPLKPGDTVRMRLPGKTSWSTGICRGLIRSRSYDSEVEAGGNVFTQDCRQLIRVDKLYHHKRYLTYILINTQPADKIKQKMCHWHQVCLHRKHSAYHPVT